MKKSMKDFTRYDRTIIYLLFSACIISLLVNIIDTRRFTATMADTTTKLVELMIQQEPDFIEGTLPNKKLGRFNLTWYCPCEKCIGKKKVIRTATGTTPKANRNIAVDPKQIPLGSIVYIEGYGYFIAEDTGSAIKQRTIDIYVDTHQEALKNGKKVANVYLLK